MESIHSVKMDPKGVKRKTGFSEMRNMVGAKEVLVITADCCVYLRSISERI